MLANNLGGGKHGSDSENVVLRLVFKQTYIFPEKSHFLKSKYFLVFMFLVLLNYYDLVFAL